MLENKKSKYIKGQKGFTLIEIAIVILIMGITLGMAGQYLKIYMAQVKYDATLENIKLTQSGLYEFYAQNGRYPCPADPTLSPDDPQFGVEHCRNPAVGGCVADGVVCTNVGAGDPENNGADYVMIGAIPVRTITEDLSVTLGLDTIPIESTPFFVHNGYDGFGMKFTYAVTEQLADPSSNNTLDPANPNLGAIRLIDENNVNLTFPAATAQYIVVSQGENSEGAYNKEGIRMSGCTVLSLDGITPAPPGPSPAGNATEKENCDYDDAIFVKSPRSFVENDFYYDDVLGFKPSGRAQLWVKVAAENPGESYIKNNNLGFVGVGLENPQAPLHVDGDISAENGTWAQKYCAQDGTNCINPEDIAGTGSKCPDGQIATGIDDEGTDDDRIELKCEAVFKTIPKGVSCPNGQAIQSMTYDTSETVTLNCVDINP